VIVASATAQPDIIRHDDAWLPSRVGYTTVIETG
jgi:hypothetical protein